MQQFRYVWLLFETIYEGGPKQKDTQPHFYNNFLNEYIAITYACAAAAVFLYTAVLTSLMNFRILMRDVFYC